MNKKQWKRVHEETSFFSNYLINHENTLAMQLVCPR